MSQPKSKAEVELHALPTVATERAGLEEALGADLESIRDAGLERFLRHVAGAQDPEVELDGRRTLLLCSNNYLGLANHPEVVEAARQAAARHGASAVSSRLISGHMTAHVELEEAIAAWKQCERALTFSTGYQANIGVITSLVDRGDVVVSDELNHASIIDGCRLSRAHVAVYRHNDVDHLAHVLDEHRGARRLLVATESVFSMDGDRAPLADIVAVTKPRGAWLMVDEAHGAGVFGPDGAGLAAEQGVAGDVDVHVGTLGKALGSFGAYVAGSAALCELLINRARSFIFTTGLPPTAAAAASAALRIVRREPERAVGLLARARSLGLRLRGAGLDVPHVDTQILPVLLGPAHVATSVASALLARGVYVAAIRPPTVPQGTSRLRVSLMATHTTDQIDRAAEAIVECVRGAR